MPKSADKKTIKQGVTLDLGGGTVVPSLALPAPALAAPALQSLVADYGILPTPRRRSMLNSSCAVSAMIAFPAMLSVGIMLAGPVQAQTTISSNKSSTVNLADSGNYAGGNPFTITNGTTVSTNSGNGVYGSNSESWTLTNNGSIHSSAASGVYLYAGGTVTNTGSISGAGAQGDFGIVINEGDGSVSGGTVVNSGNISGDGGVGLFYGGAVTNSLGGTITASSSGVYASNEAANVANDGSIGGTTYGADLLAGGTVTNQSLGVMSGATALYIGGDTGSVNNAGTLQGNGDSGIGIVLNDGGTVTNQNNALITGSEFALFGNDNAVSVDNSGTITAGISSGDYGVDLLGTGNTVTNNASIHGNVGVYNYSGKIDNTAGSISGTAIGTEFGAVTGSYLKVTGGAITANGGTTGVGALFLDSGSIYNNATISGTGLGVELQSGGTLANHADGHITGGTGVYLEENGSVSNAGTILGTTDSAVYLDNGGTITNVSGGLISGSTYGVLVKNAAGTVGNAGTILGGTTVGDYGVDLDHSGSTLTNSGSIGGRGGAYVLGGTIINSAGTIGGQVYGVKFGSVTGSYLHVTGGTITGTGGQGVGAEFTDGGTLMNDSTITGTAYGAKLMGGGMVSNEASAEIAGGVGLDLGGTGTVSNFGSIFGTAGSGVALSGGGTLTNQSTGLITGTSYGVLAADSSPASINNVGTIRSGTVAGDYGVSLKYQGSTLTNSGSINGHSGAYVYNGTVDNITGTIGGMAYGVKFGTLAGSYLKVTGGLVAGTVANFGIGAEFANNGSIYNNGTISGTDLGARMAGGGTVTNQASGVITGSLGIYVENAAGSLNNSGAVSGTLSDGVHFVAGGAVTNSGTITGANSSDAYGVLLTGGAGSISNSGYIKGYSGAELGDGGVVGNTETGTIAGNILGVFIASGPGTVLNNGTISETSTQSFAAAVALDGGYISNSGTGILTGAANGVTDNAAAGTIRNFGTIEGTSGTIGNGLNFTQYGSIYNGGLISGTNDGVLFKAGGTISNDGSILGGNAGISIGTVGALVHNESADVAGYISGSIYGVLITSENGSVINAGTIIGNNTDSISAYAVRITNGGNVTNSASGSIMASSEGVNISGGAGTLDNSGMIDAFGTSSGVSGVLLLGGGYVHNAGTNATIFGGGAGVAFADVAGTLNNAGSIGGGVYGVSFGSAGGSLNNTGLITGGTDGVFLTATSFTNAGTIIGSAGSAGSGVYLTLGGTVTNSVGGYIAGPSRGVYILGGGTVINAGTIRNGTGTATVSSPPVGPDITPLVDYNRPFGVLIQGGGVVTNSTGAYIEGDSVAVGIYGNSLTSAYVTNAASGTIHGGRDGVNLYAGSNTLLNAGTITAGQYGVDLGSGNLTNAASGVISAAYDGVYLDSFGTVDNSGTITQSGTGPAYAAAYLAAGGYVINRAGGTIVGTSNGIYGGAASNLTVVNAGTIGASFGGDPTVGILVGEGDVATITNNAGGVIYSNGLAAIGGYDGYMTVNNSGTITSAGYGIRQSSSSYGGLSVTNFGTIIGGGADGIFGYFGSIYNYNTIESTDAIGVQLFAGTVYNQGLISGGTDGIYIEGNGSGDATIQNQIGTIEGLHNAGIELGSGGSVYNSGSAAITGKYNGIYVAMGIATINSYGRITGTYASGIQLHGGGVVNNQYNTFLGTGTISGKYDGVFAEGATATVNNHGLIEASKYDGVYLLAGGTVSNLYNTMSAGRIIGNYNGVQIGTFETATTGTVLNHGTIAGSFGNGVILYGEGNVTNYDEGTIFGGHAGVNLFSSSASLLNDGTITSGYFGSGVRLQYSAQAVNYGRIAGGARGAGIYIFDGGIVTNKASGTITGQYGVRSVIGAAAHIYNAGSIYGSKIGVSLYNGTLVNAGTTDQSGAVFGDQTGVLITNGGEVFNGGTITGNSGTGVSFSGGGYIDNYSSNGATGTIIGGSIGIGTAYDYVYVHNSGTVSGGNVGVSVAESGFITNSGLIAGTIDEGVYMHFGTVNNQIGGTITSDRTGVEIFSNFASVQNAGTISGGSFAGVYLGYGGSLNNLAGGTISGGSYGVLTGYTSNTASNLGMVLNYGNIYSPGTAVALLGLGTGSGSGLVVNNGFIDGDNAAVYLANGGTVINEASAALGGAYGVKALGGPAIVINRGLLDGNFAVDLQRGGTVANQAYGTIVGNLAVAISNGAALVTNAPTGFIFGLVDGVAIGYAEESLATPGTVENGGTIAGFNYGVSMFDAGTVTNTGTIEQVYSSVVTGAAISMNNGGLVDDESGGILLGATGVTFANTAGTLLNAGSITGDDNAGVVLAGGGYVGNTGTIMGATGGVATGYAGETTAFAGTVENSGLLTGGTYGVWLHGGGMLANDAGGTISSRSIGVQADGVATLFNDGLVTASTGTAVELNSGGSLQNRGTIAGYGYGIIAGGVVSITNTGLVTASTAVDLTSGGSIFNSGTISGAADGVLAGTKATVTNTGLFSGTVAADLAGGGALTNTGNITGGTDGLRTGGTITVMNTGTITGTADAGVALGAGTFTNEAGGTISGGTDGVTAGNGAGIVNAGLIEDSPAPEHAGVVLSGTAALTNLATGTISGTTGVLIEGNDTSLLDLGTIIGTGGQAITIDPTADPAQITLGTGASLTGDIDGGGTAGQITLTGHNALGNTITDFGTGSGLTVANGANWTATGDWTIATVTNDGTFQPGVLGTPLRLTGNFVQVPGGTLQVVVTPTMSSQFIVTGTATLAGNLSYEFAPGTYSPHTYDFLSASGGKTGSFSTVSYNGSVPVFLTHDTSLFNEQAHLDLSQVINPQDESLLGDSSQAAAQAAQEAGDGMLDHAANGGGTSSAAACAAEAGVTPASTSPYGTSTASRLASAIGNAFCGAGGWVEATGAATTVNNSGAAAGYTADQGGFMAGVDHAVNQHGTRIGLAIGYDENWLNDQAGGKATVDTTRLGIYAAQPLGQFTLAGDFMLGLANNTTTRPTGVGNAKASYGSTDYAGGIQAATQYSYRGVTIQPAAGLRIASVTNGGFAENGAGAVPAFSLSAAGSTETSVQPYVKLDLSKGFLTPSMTLITPDLSVGYDYEAGNTGQSVSTTARDGTHFDTFRTSLGRSTATIGAGISASKGNWSLFAKYSAYLSGNWTSQIGEAGFTMKF